MSTEQSGMPKDEAPVEVVGPRRASAARRSRRKKDDDNNTTTSTTNTPDTRAKKKEDKEKEKEKEKPTRAPRRPREKSSATAASRKKPKLEQSGDEAAALATSTPAAAAAASTPTPTPAAAPPSAPTPPAPTPPAPPADPTPPPQAAPTPPQPTPTPSFKQSPRPSPPDPRYTITQDYPSRPQSQPPPLQPTQAPPAPAPAPAPALPRTSGRNFDPIRSAFDNPSPAPVYSPPPTLSPRNSYRASASPAISSIIDPPGQTQPSYAPLPRSSSAHVSAVSSPAPPPMAHTPTHHTLAPSPIPASPSHGAVHTPQQQPHTTSHYTPYSEQRPIHSQPPQLELSPPALQQPQPQPQPQSNAQPQRPAEPPAQAATPQRPPQQPDAMDIDSKEPTASTKKEKGTTTAPSSKAPSPKPARAAKEAPKIPQGSGLITNALFGGVDESSKSDARSVPNIIVHVPLQKGNQIVNFAQLAEEQYGFAALHPRLAAHKDRLARVAAAGAALERNDKGLKGISAGESADEDLSLDVDRDSDLDGDVSMGGAGTGTNGVQSEASEGKKKRRKKVEEYDRDDPFVDDSEMAWQEQAAASKDGFFVYSGPLVPEGEKVQVERADGTIKRGRGRGRGTGRARSLASHPHVPIAAAVPISQETGLPLRGPGSRGGVSRRGRGAKKADASDKHTDRAGTSASTSHEGRGGRGGGSAGRGGSSSRGGKSSMMSVLDIAPAPGPQGHAGNLAPAPVPGPSPLAGPEVVMK